MYRLFDLVNHQAEERPGSVLLAAKIQGVWETFSAKEVVESAKNLASGLLSLGFIKNEDLHPEKQTKIAIVSNNRPEWLITDLAVQQTGAILTPIYPTVSPEDFEYILNEAEVSAIFFSNDELYTRFAEVLPRIEKLQHVYSFDPIEGVSSWETLKASPNGDQAREEVVKRIQASTLATI